jgi:chromosomal replication initiator protein
MMPGTVTDDIGAINQALAERIGPQKYGIWFKNSTRLTLSEGYLKIDVSNSFIAGWIESHFLNDINQVVHSVTGAGRKVTFAIDPQLSGHQRRPQLDNQVMLAKRAQGNFRQQAMQPGQTKKLKLSLETFVVGPSNELAYNAALAVAREKQSPFNPLFIHGGYGVGKTHLLQGICNAVSKCRPGTNWLYLSAEDFVNQFVLALKIKKLEAFRRRMRETDLLAIDDIHFLASKPSTQEEFLHTFNTIDMAGKQIVLVSDSHPKMIGQISDKLVNRFVSGMVAKIETPDLQTRCAICRQYVNAMQKQVPENVIRYVAENLRTNIRELEGALLKIVAFTALQNVKINLALAQEVLSEHLSRTDPIVHISDIESAVATFFGLTQADLHSSKKDKTISLARHFSMYLARQHTKMSFPEIGKCMGNKNHATVLLACKKIEDQLKLDVQLRWQGPSGNKVASAKTILAHLQESISS